MGRRREVPRSASPKTVAPSADAKMADASLLAFNFSLGLAAFFSPCGFPMLPAYMAYYLPRADTSAPHGLAPSLARGLGGGLLAALGALVVLLAIGGLAVAIGAPFKERVAWLELAGGLLVISFGVAMLRGRSLSFKVAMRPSQARSALSLFGFGGLYAATASSCVAPILLGVLVPAFSAPTLLDGMLQVGAYAAGMALLLVVASVLVATSQGRALQAFRRVVPHVERVAGWLLVAAGAYLVWYWAAVELGAPAPPSLPTP